jgi:hypothetical protein
VWPPLAPSSVQRHPPIGPGSMYPPPPRRIGADIHGRLWLFQGATAPVRRVAASEGDIVMDLSATSDSVRNGRGRSYGGSHDAEPRFPQFDFEPAHIQAMHRAFDAVCVKLQLSMASEDKLTELVEEKVIELATAGERNVETLTARVLAEFGFENDGSLWRH